MNTMLAVLTMTMLYHHKLLRKAGSEFWVQGWYENGTYQGLIHYKTCPRNCSCCLPVYLEADSSHWNDKQCHTLC